jgi:quercetin dioxygenase-like cupin family protein
MFMSLIRGIGNTGCHAATLSWTPRVDMADAHPAGHITRDLSSDGLSFVLSREKLTGTDVLTSHDCEMPNDGALLRVDEVCFPVGAIAHRHTHTGAGIRHLVRGALRIEADDHSQTLGVGESWFEAAGSPVRAVALQQSGVSSFLRGMIIPAHCVGKSTFALVDPADANLLRLQVTHRHVDLPL